MSMPHRVRARILKGCATGEPVVVIPGSDGRPKRVHKLEEYLAAKERAKKIEPWKFKKSRTGDSVVSPSSAATVGLQGSDIESDQPSLEDLEG